MPQPNPRIPQKVVFITRDRKKVDGARVGGDLEAQPTLEKTKSMLSDESTVTRSLLSEDEQEEEEEEEELTDSDDSDLKNDALLAYATIRLESQHLKEEVASLKHRLRGKDEQILQLAGQLQRATASKCDLVVAITELERQKELALRYGSKDAQGQRQKYLKVLEERAEIEVSFMNELNDLTNRMVDMDRRHKNQMVEKDFIIAQLNEELRRRTGTHRQQRPAYRP